MDRLSEQHLAAWNLRVVLEGRFSTPEERYKMKLHERVRKLLEDEIPLLYPQDQEPTELEWCLHAEDVLDYVLEGIVMRKHELEREAMEDPRQFDPANEWEG